MSGLRAVAGSAEAMAKANKRYQLLSRNMSAKKRIFKALAKIYGVGEFEAKKVIHHFGLNPTCRVEMLDKPEINKFNLLAAYMSQNYDPIHIAKRSMGEDILAKVRLNSYQGIRHSQALPVRGQNTHSNANDSRKFGQRRLVLYGIPPFQREMGGSQKPEKVAERLRLLAKDAQDRVNAALMGQTLASEKEQKYEKEKAQQHKKKK